ncbi:hypothetical protein ACOMHN_066524 [Nucella lapillus]
MSPCILSPDNDNVSNEAQPITGGQSQGIAAQEPKRKKAKSRPASASEAGWSIQQRPCSLASITTAAGQSTHCPGTLAFITAAAGWSTQRCPRTLALIIDIAAVS